MQPNKDKSAINKKTEDRQERHEQAQVAGAGRDEPFESQTGRKGASQNVEGTKQPGDAKD